MLAVLLQRIARGGILLRSAGKVKAVVHLASKITGGSGFEGGWREVDEELSVQQRVDHNDALLGNTLTFDWVTRAIAVSNDFARRYALVFDCNATRGLSARLNDRPTDQPFPRLGTWWIRLHHS